MNNKKRVVIIVISIILLLLVIGVVTFLTLNKQVKSQEENIQQAKQAIYQADLAELQSMIALKKAEKIKDYLIEGIQVDYEELLNSILDDEEVKNQLEKVNNNPYGYKASIVLEDDGNITVSESK